MSKAELGASESAFSVKGRTAIVTGSGRNIGKAIAMTLARAGAKVVINGRRMEPLLDVVRKIETFGGQALAVGADVSKPDDIAKMVERAQAEFGTVDIVIANVGIRKHKPFLDLSVDEWKTALEVNLNSAFYLAQATLPLMMKGKWGRFIGISGVDAFIAPDSERAHIIVSKLGLFGLTKALAREFGEYGITSNAISPGMMATDRDWSQFPGFSRADFESSLPLRRMGNPADIASTAHYLCSDAAAFVTGQVIHVNGGQQMF